MKVLLDTTPLQNANAIRGVGAYTRFLAQELHRLETDSFQLVSTHQEAETKDVSDIIHYPFFDLFFHTLQYSNFHNSKAVVTIHDVIPLLYPDKYPVGIKGKINFWLQKRSLAKVEAVITDSNASKKDIVRLLGVPASKVHVVYLAGNPQIQHISEEKALQKVVQKYELPSTYILYVGDINYNKNIPQLVEALRFIDEDVHLVCVGKNFYPHDIPEWHSIHQAVITHNLADRIHFIANLGTEATADLSALYSQAICYVQPSLYEGFGLPVLEALQCYTPVVCARNSSLSEVGGDVVKYAATDAQSLGQAVQHVISNHNLFSTNSWQKKVDKHLAEFSWEKTAQDTLTVYKSL